MSYRDDLDAAFARIAQLEAALEQADGGQSADLAPLLKKIATLEGELRKTQASMRERVAATEAQLRAALVQASPEMPTLVQHNRSFPPAREGSPAGVICPRCQTLGDAVEMVVRASLTMVRGTKDGCEIENKSALCPRCLYLQVLRTR